MRKQAMFVRRHRSTTPSTLIHSKAGVPAVLVASCLLTAASPALAEDAAPAAQPAKATTLATSGTSVVPAPDVPAVTTREQPLPNWLKTLSLGGGAILWYYSPVETG